MLTRLAHVPHEALPRPGMRCLDVGAGTGAFALYAADQGADVTATDVSEGMLAQLSANDPKRRVTVVRANWHDVDPQARGWVGGFDLVLAQMMPGIRTPEDFRRMEACCRGWCAYIGWGRKRHDPWLEAVFAAHGATLHLPPGTPIALEQLAAIGREVTPVWIEEAWHAQRTAEDAILDAMSHLRMRGVEPNPEQIKAMARALNETDGFSGDEVEIGVLAWQV
jgi:SAM-dependent methyltransferase